jgi:CrcB protein
MRAVLLVGAGGFLGSVCRYLLGGWVHRTWPFVSFPIGTLAINAAGCFLIGWLAGLAEGRLFLGPETRLFLLIGVLGGFTTFSSFAYETLALARDAELGRALANIALQVILSLAAAWLGNACGRL